MPEEFATRDQVRRQGAPVRIPLSVRRSSRRTLEQRLAIQFPGLAALAFRLVLVLPPRSRLRQAMLRQTIEQGIAAFNRRDYEALRPTFHPQVEAIPEPEAVALGFEEVYRGWEGWVRFQDRWTSEWGEYQIEPRELIDLGGGRLLVIGNQLGLGLGSGAATSNDWAYMVTIVSGRVIREQSWFSCAEALKAAGLEE